jgi:hypothetical protein
MGTWKSLSHNLWRICLAETRLCRSAGSRRRDLLRSGPGIPNLGLCEQETLLNHSELEHFNFQTIAMTSRSTVMPMSPESTRYP